MSTIKTVKLVGEDPDRKLYRKGMRIEVIYLREKDLPIGRYMFPVKEEIGECDYDCPQCGSYFINTYEAIAEIKIPDNIAGITIKGIHSFTIVNPEFAYAKEFHAIIKTPKTEEAEAKGWYKGDIPEFIECMLAPVEVADLRIKIIDQNGNPVQGARITFTYQGGTGVHPDGPFYANEKGIIDIYCPPDFKGMSTWCIESTQGSLSGFGTVPELVILN